MNIPINPKKKNARPQWAPTIFSTLFNRRGLMLAKFSARIQPHVKYMKDKRKRGKKSFFGAILLKNRETPKNNSVQRQGLVQWARQRREKTPKEVKMREIILDLETTGLYPQNGDRIIEVGCLEIIDKKLSSRFFQRYVNPQRDVPAAVTDICGLTEEFLRPYPPFKDIVKDLLEFLEDSPFVIHNAPFDMSFLNAELERLSMPILDFSRAFDTLQLARDKFPGQPANLDALAKRFHITSPREKHGAIVDCQILTEVYLNLTEERQKGLGFEEPLAVQPEYTHVLDFPRRSFPLSEQKALLFQRFASSLPLWASCFSLQGEDDSDTAERGGT
jgi:DNA polymerase-3 subunit epsilon